MPASLAWQYARQQQLSPVSYDIEPWRAAVGIGRSTVYRLMDEGRIDYVNIGRRRLITISPQDFINSLRK